MLVLESIAAGYGDLVAVRSVSLEIHPGECVALIGANGAGKTTTLRAIAGLLPLRAGRIVFEGRPRPVSIPAGSWSSGWPTSRRAARCSRP